jgi:hypothetical protein
MVWYFGQLGVAMNNLAKLTIASLAVAVPSSGHAANISVSDLGPNNPVAVLVVGELLLSDGDQFRSKVGGLGKAVVIFQSDGGAAVTGIDIGETIRLKNFATLVPSQVRCASACALAWLGGAPRIMAADAQVGFHAAYVVRGGQALETGIGNALIGAYLNRIGLSYSAVAYITGPAPTSMSWLNAADAMQHGIGVAMLDGADQSARKSANAQGAPIREHALPRLEERATRFVESFVAGWSSTNAVSLASLASAYADQVSYYGSLKSRQEVFVDKQRFAERWPERAYDVQPGSTAQCFADGCVVNGVANWRTRSVPRGTSATGMARFEYRVQPSHGAFLILSENGSVIRRDK